MTCDRRIDLIGTVLFKESEWVRHVDGNGNVLLLLFPISFFCLYLPLLMRRTHHYLLLFTLTRIQPRVRI